MLLEINRVSQSTNIPNKTSLNWHIFPTAAPLGRCGGPLAAMYQKYMWSAVAKQTFLQLYNIRNLGIYNINKHTKLIRQWYSTCPYYHYYRNWGVASWQWEKANRYWIFISNSLFAYHTLRKFMHRSMENKSHDSWEQAKKITFYHC